VKYLALLVAAACAPQTVAVTPQPKWLDDTSTFGTTPATGGSIADRYREVAAKIVAAATADRGAYAKLQQLTDHIGHRFSGSPELDRAIAWAAQTMKDDGHEVRTERAMVPHWVRGPEDAAIIAPVARPLHVIGLGGSVSTPRMGITAPIVVVRDWAELESKKESVKGAIVIFNVAMPAYTEQNGSGYGQVVEYRTRGPSRAAKLGAVATLVRSVTAHSLDTPHTGALHYDDAIPKVPAGALSVEDTLLLSRLAAEGPVRIHLHLESQQLPDAPSANVIGELRGKERPDEVVVISGHLDSWDVGAGAHDDGAGVVTTMQAITVLRKLGLVPRRTIRVVLWTNEENGTKGAKAYAADHEAELPKHVLALETDSGGFTPRGFDVSVKDPAAQARAHTRIADIATLLKGIGVREVVAGHGGGADVGHLAAGGVPLVGLEVENRTYFDIHHTQADTLDKVDPAQLAADVAAVAVLAYIVADMPERVDAAGGDAPKPAPPGESSRAAKSAP
jgi:carboxypeptidase Q